MKLKLLITLCGILQITSSCFKQELTISAVVEDDKRGSSTIKWEVYPDIDNETISVYASDNDSVFPDTPIRIVSVNNYIDVIENADSLGYKYFKLKVRDTYSPVISKRFYFLENVQNFRDIGGYVNNEGKTVRWGKIFRSGDFSTLSSNDKNKIKELEIKSIVDFRPGKQQIGKEDHVEVANLVQINIPGLYNDSIALQVKNNRFLKGDAILYMQDTYEKMFMKSADQYAAFFDFLLNKENYPLAYHCSLGKDQTGVATFLLLKALDVPIETIEEDYMLSKIGINRRKLIKNASELTELTELQQQVFIMLTGTDVSYLRYGIACVRKSEGTIDEFMQKELKLTPDKKKRLKEILLY